MKRIESIQNATVKQWKKLATMKKERDKSQAFFIEGFHLVEEALKNKERVLQIIVREDVALPMLWDTDDIPMFEVTAQVAKELAETETTQGVFAVCKQESNTNLQGKHYLLLDAIQDPGNLGTMIRTADAAGVETVILGNGTVDAFNAKTLRAAQGSHFHITLMRMDLEEALAKLMAQDTVIYGTSLDDATLLTDVSPAEKWALIVGNEGSGISPQLLAKTDENIKIPMRGKAESLNVAVATGILLYRLIL